MLFKSGSVYNLLNMILAECYDSLMLHCSVFLLSFITVSYICITDFLNVCHVYKLIIKLRVPTRGVTIHFGHDLIRFMILTSRFILNLILTIL